MDRIIESISSSNEGYATVEDCITKAAASAAGAFCAGFSAGAAAQVHYAKYLPKPVKALLVIPAATASLAAVGMYKHNIKQCELQYMTQAAPIVHTISLHPAIQTTDMKIEKV